MGITFFPCCPSPSPCLSAVSEDAPEITPSTCGVSCNSVFAIVQVLCVAILIVVVMYIVVGVVVVVVSILVVVVMVEEALGSGTGAGAGEANTVVDD